MSQKAPKFRLAGFHAVPLHAGKQITEGVGFGNAEGAVTGGDHQVHGDLMASGETGRSAFRGVHGFVPFPRTDA